MGVLIASVAGGKMSIMTTRRRKSPEQIEAPVILDVAGLGLAGRVGVGLLL